MIVRAHFRAYWIGTLWLVLIIVGMRVEVITGLRDSVGVFVDVLECGRVGAAENDPEDH